MANYALRFGIAGVAAVVGLGVKFMHRSSAGEDCRNLFAWMIDQANGDNARQVGDAPARYRTEHVH